MGCWANHGPTLRCFISTGKLPIFKMSNERLLLSVSNSDTQPDRFGWLRPVLGSFEVLHMLGHAWGCGTWTTVWSPLQKEHTWTRHDASVRTCAYSVWINRKHLFKSPQVASISSDFSCWIYASWWTRVTLTLSCQISSCWSGNAPFNY